MAASHHKQHALEFGGSHVSTEFDGSLQFRLIARIPYITVSQDFTEKTARQIRYALVATVGPERPFYHRHHYVILDVRMIRNWQAGSAEFVKSLAERMSRIDGYLALVATGEVPVSGVPTFESEQDAVTETRRVRAERRSASLQKL
jgi:hypothetical protein